MVYNKVQEPSTCMSPYSLKIPLFLVFFQVSYNEYTVAILSFFLPLSNTAINAIYRHTCNVAKIKHVHIKIGLF